MKMHSPGHSSADSTTASSMPSGNVGQTLGAARVGEDLVAFLDVGETVVEQGEHGGRDLLAEAVAGAEILVDPDLHRMSSLLRFRSPGAGREDRVERRRRDQSNLSHLQSDKSTSANDSVRRKSATVSDARSRTLNAGLGSDIDRGGVSSWLSEHERRLTEYEAQVDQLQETIKGLEEEVVVLRRRLQDAPKRVRTLEERLLETKGQLAQAVSQNEKLSATLREAREHIAALREEVEKLTMPPSAYGTYLGTNDDGTVDIFTAGRKMRVALHPELDADELRRGQEVVLNESLNVVLARGSDVAGEVVTFKELLEDGTRAFVVGRADEERVCELADELLSEKLRAGDHLLMEGRSGLLLEKLPRPEVEELVLEEVPDVSYDDVGGLDDQIEMIKDAVELPYLYGDLFQEHELQPPKGILLYGPPGCGKTLIAKAVANSLAKRVAEKTGNTSARSYFLNIKGPELLNKYVGETERQIRLDLPAGAREERRGLPGHRVLRRDGLAVPHARHRHLLRHRVDDRAAAARGDRRRRGAEERDRDRRVEPRGPHRPRDPAARPPRREDQDRAPRRRRARSRSSRSTSRPNLPIAETELKHAGGDAPKAVSAHDRQRRRRTCTRPATRTSSSRSRTRTATRRLLYFKDFSSGAMIENIVRRAKKLSIKRTIAGGERGIGADDLLDSIKQEFREHEDLPNTTNPDDWAKISGKKGERIVYVRTIVNEGESDQGGRQIERVTTGQYL